MGRPADIQPRWLVSLMSQWARRAAQDMDGGNGYPAKSSFLTIGVQRSSRTDPTEFCARDYRELEAALKWLLGADEGAWRSMMMYYKPWVVDLFRVEGWPFGNSTYFSRLHRAHRLVSEKIEGRDEQIVAEKAEME